MSLCVCASGGAQGGIRARERRSRAPKNKAAGVAGGGRSLPARRGSARPWQMLSGRRGALCGRLSRRPERSSPSPPPSSHTTMIRRRCRRRRCRKKKEEGHRRQPLVRAALPSSGRGGQGKGRAGPEPPPA